METSKLDTKELLLSRRLEKIVLDPFCFFYVDDYLPTPLYESLRKSFPEESDYSSNHEGKMGFRSSENPEEVERFGATHPQWQALLDFFGSDEFVCDVQATLSEALIRASGLSGRRPWHNCTHRSVSNNPLRYLLREPMRTTHQFSLLPNDGIVLPHSDAPRKLVSLLLYFRDSDWQDAWGGDIEFYVPLDPEKARSFAPTDRIPFEDLKIIDTCEFRGNRLAGFVRSPNSYHGVRAPTCPPGRTRKALLVNLKRLKWSKRHQL